MREWPQSNLHLSLPSLTPDELVTHLNAVQHTPTRFLYFFYIFYLNEIRWPQKKRKKKKKAYLMIGYLFSRFRHVMSTLASRPMTPVVGRLPSSFTSLSRKEKPSLPGPLTRLGQHTAARRRAPLPLSFLLGVYKITYDGLRESVQKISFFLNEEKFKKLPKFWAFIFLVAFVLFFSIYSFSRMTTSFFFSCFIACVDGKFLKATSGLVTSVHVWLSRQWWDIDREREREIDTG